MSTEQNSSVSENVVTSTPVAAPVQSMAAAPSPVKPYITPLAILLGSIVIASALYFKDTGTGGAQPQLARNGAPAAPTLTITAEEARRAEGGHVYGSPDAKTTIVEFSDYECPFCARLHPTLKRIVDESNGTINWEYRHLPLPNHPNARPGAIASECVAKYAGNEAFWTFTDKVFAALGTQSAAFFEKEALALGVKAADYKACIADPAIAAQVDADAAMAAKAGGQGTPHSVVVKPNGTITPVSGALPYEQWQAILASE